MKMVNRQNRNLKKVLNNIVEKIDYLDDTEFYHKYGKIINEMDQFLIKKTHL